MSAEDYEIRWEGNPSADDLAWGDQIVDILDDWYEMALADAYQAEQKWRVYPPDSYGSSMTFFASPGAVEDVRYMTDVEPAERQNRLNDPNYQLTDEDMVEFDIPREPYVSRSNPPVGSPRPRDLPRQESHRIDVRPRRRGPRMPREQT
jgi:hypothetical protein